ncbi:NAD(P)H-binding protein [Gloeobacter kilaueensis]|uniref:NmrA family protein n=1 Tax=Gloeobacter kilaueensis (strain ATCC BAA-2537 / CCAP 1431/1 / ULC 316 / JS1) TaxID=1183438 RepID=U5QFA6_GLOK1|nr:NAD(P)H-binding protein [Gloeobacter kilaueensis]AGY57563.1 NmrA family protein [Gloeobacter kilaueensis JS1]
MIVVTGASGQLGRRIVEQLLKRIAPERIGVSVRDPAKAADLAGCGVRVRAGDFADPESLRASFEGATQVLITSSNARVYGGDPLVQHRNAIEAARAAGAERIVYTSHMAASDRSAFPPMLEHAATEAMLAESGLAWTALRNGFYAQSALQFMGDWRNTGVIAAPEDGPVCWTTHSDLAGAVAVVLSEPGRFDGPTPPLTGSEALDLAALAQIASEILGRPVERLVIPDDHLQSAMTARGALPYAVNALLGFYRAGRAGEFAAMNPTLGTLLGYKPTAMAQVLAGAV